MNIKNIKEKYIALTKWAVKTIYSWVGKFFQSIMRSYLCTKISKKYCVLVILLHDVIKWENNLCFQKFTKKERRGKLMVCI